MPDDMPHTTEAELAGDQPQSSSSADEAGASSDRREKSCDYGSCTFVTGWYEKVNAQAEARKNSGATDPGLHADTCQKCNGMFVNTATALLPMIKCGAKDKMGHTILQVYLSGEDYTIYRTRQGVNVNFADCRLREREQRLCYEKISEKLCGLRFLTSQMAGSTFGLSHLNMNGGFYDHQIAEAIYLALQKKPDNARKILDDGLQLAGDRITNENRVRYLVACLLVGLIPGAVLCLPYGSIKPMIHQTWIPYLLAAVAGAAGAVFSIAMRIQDLDLKPCTQSVMNYVMGALRVLTGFVAGAMILFIINGTVFGEGIIKLFETTSMADLSLASWKCIMVAGFLGGFAERLVPSLLWKLQSTAEHPTTDGPDNAAVVHGKP